MTQDIGMTKQHPTSVDEYLDSEDELVFFYDPSGIKPPEELMAKAIRMMVADPKDTYGVTGRNIKNWAQANCKTFFWYDVTDVSDASYTMDEIHCYYFIDERDVTLFTLRWGGSRHEN
jgi:hypothetical protein